MHIGLLRNKTYIRVQPGTGSVVLYNVLPCRHKDGINKAVCSAIERENSYLQFFHTGFVVNTLYVGMLSPPALTPVS